MTKELILFIEDDDKYRGKVRWVTNVWARWRGNFRSFSFFFFFFFMSIRMALIVKWDKHGRVCLVGMNAEACWQLHSATDWLTRTKTAEPWSLTKEYFWTEPNKSQILLMIHLLNPDVPTTIFFTCDYNDFYFTRINMHIMSIVIEIFSYTST